MFSRVKIPSTTRDKGRIHNLKLMFQKWKNDVERLTY